MPFSGLWGHTYACEPTKVHINMNENLSYIHLPFLFKGSRISQILPFSCFTTHSPGSKETRKTWTSKTKNTLKMRCRWHNRAIYGFPFTLHFCGTQTVSTFLESCVFLYVSSYCSNGSHTFLSGSHTQCFVSCGTMIIPFKFSFKVK